MFTFRISSASQKSVCRAASLRAFVATTRFKFVTYFWALKLLWFSNFLTWHNQFLLAKWIVNLITQKLLFSFLAITFPFNHLLAPHTLISVTFLSALVESTRKEFLTLITTSWYRISAKLSFSAQQFFNFYVSWRAKNYSFWVFVTWLTWPSMTNLLTLMFATIQKLSANIFTWRCWLSTNDVVLFFATKAYNWINNIAWGQGCSWHNFWHSWCLQFSSFRHN